MTTRQDIDTTIDTYLAESTAAAVTVATATAIAPLQQKLDTAQADLATAQQEAGISAQELVRLNGQVLDLQSALAAAQPMGMPDHRTTGLQRGTSFADLPVHAGDFIINSKADVPTDLAIAGRIINRTADQVSGENFWVAGPPTSYPQRSASGALNNTALIDANSSVSTGKQNLHLKDFVLSNAVPSVAMSGIIGHDFDVSGFEIFNVVDGINIYNAYAKDQPANVDAHEFWIHDLDYITPDPNHPAKGDGTHNDDVQIQGNGGIRLSRGRLEGFASKRASVSPYAPNTTGNGIAITPNVSAVTDVHLEDLWIDGSARPITFIRGGFPIAADPRITFKNVRLGPNAWAVKGVGKRTVVIDPGYMISDTDLAQLVWDATGAPLAINAGLFRAAA